MEHYDNDTPICLSGGAEGADMYWGNAATHAGQLVIHYIFDGHRSKASKDQTVVLTNEQLLLADPSLIEANKKLKRVFPSASSFVNALLRRNFYQIRPASSLYAVSTIKDGIVEGGTSWAVAMFINKFGGGACPAYVFDQNDDHWYVWSGEWVRTNEVPTPTDIWAGIGSRKLTNGGKAAIDGLF
jgi:hypothetical protein